MTVLSTLPAEDQRTPLNRDILMALFNPLGRCRFMEEKVRRLDLTFISHRHY